MNSTTLTNQVQEHFSSATQNIVVINSEKASNSTELLKARKNPEAERKHWIEQKLSQRSYVSGYRGL